MPRQSIKSRHSQRKQLDRRISRINRDSLRPPVRGWVRAIREALGLNRRQMAERMGVVPSHLSHVEAREVDGGITVRTLRRAADALECDVVYALVPRAGSLEDTLAARARAVAAALVKRVDAHMALEDQRTSHQARRDLIESTAAELVRSLDKKLWDVPL